MYSIQSTDRALIVSGSRCFNRALRSSVVFAPTTLFFGVIEGSAFGVGCSRKVCLPERATAPNDFSFVARMIEKFTGYTRHRRARCAVAVFSMKGRIFAEEAPSEEALLVVL